MDITSGVERVMDQGTSNGSGSKGWIKEKFKRAMGQGASIESELNRRSDYYVFLILMSDNDSISNQCLANATYSSCRS
jgi:hypothetical protein